MMGRVRRPRVLSSGTVVGLEQSRLVRYFLRQGRADRTQKHQRVVLQADAPLEVS